MLRNRDDAASRPDSLEELTPAGFVRLVRARTWQEIAARYELSDHELGTLQATCAGHELPGIARQLHCARKTADRHRDSLHKKMEINDRLALAVRVFGFFLDQSKGKPAKKRQ